MNRHLVVFVSILFLASNLIFLMGLNWPAAAILIIGCLGGAAIVATPNATAKPSLLNAPIDLPLLIFCAVAASILCLLGGETHVFYANEDWLLRDAVLADLSLRPFPVHYFYNGDDYFLRAPLGMYMLPALVGRSLGLMSAHVTLLIQNSIILAVVLYIAGVLSGGIRLILLLIVFSGADIVPQVGKAVFLSQPMPDHLEWWASFFQYSSHITQIFWVPNHALPGWWFAALSLLAVRGEMDLAYLGVTFASLLLWSPLAVAPALPILLYLAWRFGTRCVFAWRLQLGFAVSLCFLPVALYLLMDAASIPHTLPFTSHSFLWRYPLFILIEIPHAALVLWLWRRVDKSIKGLLVLSIVWLLILPFYRFGYSNDWVMRGSITALFVLGFAFSSLALSLKPEEKSLRVITVAIIALGAVTPAFEVRRAILRHPFAISRCNFITAMHDLDPNSTATEYLARSSTAQGWLIRPASHAPLTIQSGHCWPDLYVAK